MALDKTIVLERLHKVYPDGVIYKETYTMKAITAPVHYSIYSIAKSEGKSEKQWLTDNGFIWRETGYCEADMKTRDTEWKADSPTELADSILRRYPLIGQYELSDGEFSAMFSAATDVVRKMCRPGSSLTRIEQLVLTVSTVALLKKRNEDAQDDSDTDTFWNYIYQQYGFNPENSEVAEQRVYKSFCAAIKDTLTLYHRFLAPENTMRYYTSMLLHAIAPRASIESLFEILFDFYVRNLDFQYISEDSSYKTLVKGMQARWTEKQSEVQLKSSAVMSGLKTLFLEKPGYMAVLCDALVQKMDSLLRGESFEIHDRWDRLLVDWYQKKSSAERTQLQGEKKSHKTEFVATSTERIYIQYGMENGKVGLVVPRIRLSEIGETRPVLHVYQDSREIYAGTLQASGISDLGLTTKRRFLPLDDTRADFSESLRLCGEIEYLDNTIYTSGSKLYRDVLCFDAGGNERNVKSGIIYLFSDENREFDFADEDSVTMEDHEGQLYRVNLDTVGAITVDGSELFADEQISGKARLYPSPRPVGGIELCAEGKHYHIFDTAFTLRLCLPENENPLRYQLTLDGMRLSAEEAADGELAFSLPALSDVCHSVRLVDVVQSLAVLEYPFALIPGFTWELDKTRYLETEEDALLIITNAGKTTSLPAFRMPGSTAASSAVGSDGFSYEIELPTVGCRFGEQSAFRLPERLWYKAISKGVFSTLVLPPSWKGQLMLGTKELPVNSAEQYEIGNLIHSGQHHGKEEMLWLSLRSPAGEREQLPLTQICFAPCFTEPPLQFHVNELQWLPSGRYIGDPGSRFRLSLSGPEDYSFGIVADYDKLLCRSTEIRHGRYSYEVLLQSDGVFSADRQECIYKGELVVGDENEFRFDGCELQLTKAIYWDMSNEELKSENIQPGKGIVEDLAFLGIGAPDWESIAMPEYEARLSFENRDGRRIAFNAYPDRSEYLLTNPVRLWVVNDRRLILTTAEGEVVYFDTATASIPNRDPEQTMSRAAQRARLQNPDYFEFEIRRADYV